MRSAAKHARGKNYEQKKREDEHCKPTPKSIGFSQGHEQECKQEISAANDEELFHFNFPKEKS